MLNETNGGESGQNVSLENHHMIPKCGVYFADIYHLREEPIFQVSLTSEGHKCQHQVLKQVFGDFADQRAANFCGFEKNWRNGQRAGATARKRKVEITSLKDGKVTVFDSVGDAAEHLGVSYRYVSAVAMGKQEKTANHKIRYIG